ncbi:MAG: glycosyltransferase [Candidatus Ratteibacteria bacterium]|nr:glycosyltransferase [Candidatus Ratteibacteria bacterium]
MKIAIFHDYFDEVGGAEITFLILARALEATIITTNIDRGKISELGYGDVKIISAGKVLPVKYFKQMMSKYRFFLYNCSSQFDFFIFGGFCSIFAAKKHKKNLWYCLSPERGLYDLRYRYFSKNNFFAQSVIGLLIKLDKYFAKHLKRIIAPSRNVQKRIKKYYSRESKIIHHPVSTDVFYFKKPKDYWLSVSRIDPYKRLELQLETFERTPEEKLIIIGTYSKENTKYFLRLKRMCPENVIFKGAVYDTDELSKLYAECKGFIATAQDEDFGMTVVEAMASGKPVVALNEGGYKETIIDKITGRLVEDVDPEKLSNAVREVSKNLEKYKDACVRQAKKFDTKVFIEKMKEEINNACGNIFSS